MDYEIVNLSQKTTAGLVIRTSNSDPNMTRDIGGLWEKFFSNDNYDSIPNKINGSTIGLYTNYESDVNGSYDLMTGCEVSTTDGLPQQFQVRTIPAGKYAKFILHGSTQAVGLFWSELWQMELDRKFGCDFEEYLPGGDMENMDIHVYISLN